MTTSEQHLKGQRFPLVYMLKTIIFYWKDDSNLNFNETRYKKTASLSCKYIHNTAQAVIKFSLNG